MVDLIAIHVYTKGGKGIGALHNLCRAVKTLIHLQFPHGLSYIPLYIRNHTLWRVIDLQIMSELNSVQAKMPGHKPIVAPCYSQQQV